MNVGVNKRKYMDFSAIKMPSLRNVFSMSSSSCSSPSPFDSPLKRESKDDNLFRNRGGSGLNRRLTRQRKLRHVTDEDLGLRANDERSQSLPGSPVSESRSRASSAHWSTSAVPQPLPLPIEGLNRGVEDGNPINSANGSCTAGHQHIRKFTDHAAGISSTSPTYRHRVSLQDLNVDSVHHTFNFNVPARSAPTSGLTSPTLSPQRSRTMDPFHSSTFPHREFQGWSDLEVSGHSPRLRSPYQNARSTTGVALHVNHKSLPVNSAAWPEGNNSPANVHPLPLPPGGSKPSVSNTIHNLMEKSDGSLMKGQWQKGELIGRGTYGSVYLATNRETGASCAMKEVDLIPDDPKSAECIKQLEQEIKVLRQLKHPNIVRYYGCEIVEDHFCIYLEHIYPGSINKYVNKHCGAVTESVVRNFTRHILSGLAYLHSTNTIHRDIKGANLLVDASGIVKLADFGLAKHLTGHADVLSLKGSPHWMAPEVLQAVMRNDCNSELAFAVDIWSLGCTVIEMFNGKPPWSEGNGVQALFSVLHKSPSIPETLSSEGKDFLRLCFQRNPADRPSAAKLLGHPFLRNSRDHNVSVCLKEFSGMKLGDTSQSPRDWTSHVNDLKPISPGTQIKHGKQPVNGESCTQSYAETSDARAISRFSPRSMLEVLPSVNSPELNCSPRNIGPSMNFPMHSPEFNCSPRNISTSMNVSNNLFLGVGNSHSNIFWTHGREIQHP